MASQRYRVWIKEAGKWVDCGKAPMTQKQAKRIVREIKQDHGIATKVLPAETEI